MNLRPKLICMLALAVAIHAPAVLGADDPAQREVEETRQSLREQGFKTELSDFDFSTPPEARAQEAVIKGALSREPTQRFFGHPSLMKPVGSNTAMVIWQMDNIKGPYQAQLGREFITWAELQELIRDHAPQLDAARAAILSGPMRFNLDSRGGSTMLLPHLALLKDLTQLFNQKAVIALHEGNLATALTNLMAATRLVTQWQIEPVEVSQMVRFENTRLVFQALWQALQTNGWTEAQLAQLQSEWEHVDFFTNLSETAAFRRACDVNQLRFDRQALPRPDRPQENPAPAPPVFSEFNEPGHPASYAEHGTFVDEKALLLFYRDRELELRNAEVSSNWSLMRALPGVTNVPVFESQFQSRLRAQMNMRRLRMNLQMRGGSLLSRAAQAESERRIIVAALALARFQVNHGSYPATLAELAPEFLKSAPVDFMDGRPLRYRLKDGHFLLYSMGLECIDHGGQLPQPAAIGEYEIPRPNFSAPPDSDIVWPFPASRSDAEALVSAERIAEEKRAQDAEEAQAFAQWNMTATRQAKIEKILAAAAKSQVVPDPDYHGHKASQVLYNQRAGSTNQATLAEMLRLNQVVTGHEPETITFQLPVKYDVLTNMGNLTLCVDCSGDDSDEGCAAQQLECARATNGDCLLNWSTIYEAPGRHALQAVLMARELPPEKAEICGPLLPFTTTNLCQFSLTSAVFDPTAGATFLAKLPETSGHYSIEISTTNGGLLKSITGSTSNGIIRVHWNLIDQKEHRFTGDFFNSVFRITLPDSGRKQTLNGP